MLNPSVIQKINHQFDKLRGSFLITDEKGVVIYSNKFIEAKTGFSRNEIIGSKPGQKWGGNMTKEFYEELWDNLLIKKQVVVKDVKNKRKSGDFFQDRIHISPVFDKDFRIKYFIEVKPEFQTKKDAILYSNTFIRRWQENNLRLDPLGLDWIFSILNYGRHLENSMLRQFEAQGIILSDLLEQIFVLPMNELYQNRFYDYILVLKAQKNPADFRLLYEKYYNIIFTHIFKRVGENKDVTEDLTQEVFYRAFKGLNSFKFANSSYLSYLKKICHNVLVNYYRDNKFVTSYDKEIYYESKLELKLIWEFIKILPIYEQKLLILKYRQGLKIKEIAEIFCKTENAIKLRLSRIRKKLRQLF